MLDGCEPKRRLPDPRFALQYQRGRPAHRSVDEGAKGDELLVPAEDFAVHSVARL
jgi:hypothetical protein